MAFHRVAPHQRRAVIDFLVYETPTLGRRHTRDGPPATGPPCACCGRELDGWMRASGACSVMKILFVGGWRGTAACQSKLGPARRRCGPRREGGGMNSSSLRSTRGGSEIWLHPLKSPLVDRRESRETLEAKSHTLLRNLARPIAAITTRMYGDAPSSRLDGATTTRHFEFNGAGLRWAAWDVETGLCNIARRRCGGRGLAGPSHDEQGPMQRLERLALDF